MCGNSLLELSYKLRMIKNDKRNEEINRIVSVIAVWTVLLLFVGRGLGEENLIYAIGEKHAFDNSLFQGNVYMGESVISPRFLADKIFAVMMYINGGDWGEASRVWIFFGAFIQSVAIANIAARIDKKRQMFISVIFTCLMVYCDNYLAGFTLTVPVSISIGIALAFSILSISFLIGEKRNYKMAWIFAACAIVFHIHEGIYCCVVIFLVALADSLKERKLLVRENLPIFVVGFLLAVSVVPNFLTDSMELSNEEFVYIYSVFRHPHHLLPSSMGLDSIFKTLWLNISFFFLGITVVAISKPEKKKQLVCEAGFLIGGWISAIGVMFVFTEIKPIAFISTLFISKFFKYVLLMALIYIVSAAIYLREKGNMVSSYMVLFFAFFASSYDLKIIAVLTAIVIMVMRAEDCLAENGKRFISEKTQPFSDVLFFLLMLSIKLPSMGNTIGITILLVFFTITMIDLAMKRKFKGYVFLSSIACLGMIFLSMYGRILTFENGTLSFINGEKSLKYSMGEELFELANDFKEQTDADEGFLANPDETANSGWFQVVSERNCYVIHKVISSSKCTVDDWYERYMETREFDEKTGEEIEKIMIHGGLEYVLLKENNFYKLDGRENYSVFLSSGNDSFRVYKRKEG